MKNEIQQKPRILANACGQGVLLLVLALILGLGYNSFSDSGIPLVGSVRMVKFEQSAGEPDGADESGSKNGVSTPSRSATETAAGEPGSASSGGMEGAPPAGESEPPRSDPSGSGSASQGVAIFSPVPLEESHGSEAETDSEASTDAFAGGEIREGAPLAIDIERAYELFVSGEAVFVDARYGADYIEGHILGALNLPFEEYDEYLHVLDYLPEDGLIVTYCDGSECETSLELADLLAELGFLQVRIFFGGWQQWTENDFPTEQGEGLMP